MPARSTYFYCDRCDLLMEARYAAEPSDAVFSANGPSEILRCELVAVIPGVQAYPYQFSAQGGSEARARPEAPLRQVFFGDTALLEHEEEQCHNDERHVVMPANI